MSMTHVLKTLPRYFDSLEASLKTFELRQDDRAFAVGDKLILKEWDPTKEAFTGREQERFVSHVLRGPEAEKFGLMEGFCILSLIQMNAVFSGQGREALEGARLRIEALEAEVAKLSEEPGASRPPSMTVERADVITGAMASWYMNSIGVTEERSPKLWPRRLTYSLEEMLEANAVWRAHENTRPAAADGSRSFKALPDPRLIAALYVFSHYEPCELEEFEPILRRGRVALGMLIMPKDGE